MIVATPFAEFAVSVGTPLKLGVGGFGEKRYVPILGGTVTGSISGHIVPGGGDEQSIRADGLTLIHARYVIATDDGALIRVDSQGVRSGPADIMAALLRGEKVDASQVYFRTAIRLETTAETYDHLNTKLFMASGRRLPEQVLLTVCQV